MKRQVALTFFSLLLGGPAAAQESVVAGRHNLSRTGPGPGRGA